MKAVCTYLNFNGNARQAMTFYAKGLGGDLQVSTFADMPGTPPEAKDRLSHARIAKGTAEILMASDTMPGAPFQQGNNFSIAIQCDSLAEIQSLFTAFSENGTITMALQDTPWNAHFGMLTDQFGVRWMFNYDLPKQA